MPGIDNNTILMLHFDGNFLDSSEYANVFSLGGSPTYGDGKFEQSIDFGLNGGYGILSNSPYMDFGQGSFTIDWWEYARSITGNETLMNGDVDNNFSFLLAHQGTRLFVSSNGSSWDIVAGDVFKEFVSGEWVHWALVFDEPTGVWKSYKNGEKFWEKSSSGKMVSLSNKRVGLNIYDLKGTLTRKYNALVDEFRISNVARWTEDFEPPTEPYTSKKTIKIDIPVANGIEWFVRQYPKTLKGSWQTRPNGAIVSGMPVAGIQISSLPVGTKIKIPESGESFTFIKTHQGLPSPMYDPSCDGAFVLREYPVQEMPWDSQNINVYEQTDVDVWLNGDYINRFPESVKNKILTAKWPYRKNGGKNGSNQSGENGLPRKVILIGGYELGWTSATNYMFPEDGHVLDYFKGTLTIDAKRIAYANGNAVFWGTRSPQTTSTITIFGVYTNGNFSHNGGAGNMWVRPQFILSNESYVSSEPNPDGSYNLIY